MTYTNRPSETSDRHTTNVVEFGDRVHWGSIFAGLVIAITPFPPSNWTLDKPKI